MATFDPAGPVLLDIDAAAVAVVAMVQVIPDASTVPPEDITGLRVAHDLPAPFVVEVDEDALQVSVSAPGLATLFPAESIRYRAGNTIGEVTAFGSLPANTDNVLTFRPSSAMELVFTLTVTAEIAGGTEAAATYSITIEANRDAGKAALLAAIEEFG